MREPKQPRLAYLLPVLLLLAGCGRTLTYGQRSQPCIFDSECPEGLRCVNRQCLVVEEGEVVDGGNRRFGEPCEEDSQCDSQLCLAGPRGAFCTEECDGGCPTAFTCKAVPVDGGAAVGLCAIRQPLLCQSCARDVDCGASGADLCSGGLEGRFCGQDCTFEACPEGYVCLDGPGGSRQCQPLGKTCDCLPSTLGMAKGCPSVNDAGVCYGASLCQADGGWTACTARQAAPELCNGFDDDCNGRVDDAISPRACSRSSAFGTCTGTELCRVDGGWSCDARLPAAESCNYLDDDCDGLQDEGFVDGLGRYVHPRHCGGCGNDCQLLVPRATATVCALDAQGAPVCRATACQSGTFLQADAGICLQLPDTLCRSCVEDRDCVGPGSACLTIGSNERICGRDCSAGSPYPGCPAGYVCVGRDAGPNQCVPSSQTCNCTNATLGARRSCRVSTATQTCSGYESCALSSGAPTWSACDVASYNPEICDLVDNNCNGQVDEGFRNPSTAKYDQATHCGFCNNDCTKIWSVPLQHTSGVCDAAPAMPVCKMGPCSTETVGGINYQWVDVNGDSRDGCECRRVQGNLTVDLPDRSPGVAPAPSYVDQNCDGVDGVIAHALFVSASAPPGGVGTLASPFRSVGSAVSAFAASGKQYILVAGGTYPENVRLSAGVQLYGGYSSDFKKRDPLLHTSLIRGQPASAGTLAAIHAEGIAALTPQTVVSGFTLQGLDVFSTTPDGQDGAASYAVYVRDSGAGLVITNNEIVAGRGGKGGRGLSGTQGFGRQASLTLNGRVGLSSGRAFGLCPSTLARQGGAPGLNPLCTQGNAAAGGGVVCPVFNWASNPYQGNQAQYLSSANGNGLGGYDWSFDGQSGFSCSHATESGFPSNIQDHNGRDGAAGGDGTAGAGGAGSPFIARTGSIVAGRWVPSSAMAQAGGAGAVAKGGGGGGAGGGTAQYTAGGCSAYEYGATGGGGGAGACGGGGGSPGRAGGASIAVALIFSSAPSGVPQLQGNRIQRNFGGQGGNGGFGGAGGLGGAGGFGGSATTWSASVGGKGGEGGNGGAGGGGGGGPGGPSFGILALNVPVTSWAASNTFVTSSLSNTAGIGGAGGSSSGPSATGGPGTIGASADAQALFGCTLGCPGGTTCDPYGVCVPN